MNMPWFQPSSQRRARGESPRPRTDAEVRLALSTLPLYRVVLVGPSAAAPDLAAYARLLTPLTGRERAARILDGVLRDGVGLVATCPRELAECYLCELLRMGLPCSITPA